MKKHKYVDVPPKIFVQTKTNKSGNQKSWLSSSDALNFLNGGAQKNNKIFLSKVLSIENRENEENPENQNTNKFNQYYNREYSLSNEIHPQLVSVASLSKHSPNESEDSLLKGVHALYQLSISSLGPLGSAQIVKLGVGGFANVLVTCSSQQLLRHVEVNDAIGKILLNSATNTSVIQDYGWEFLFIACKLIQIAKSWPIHWSSSLFYWIQTQIAIFFKEDHDQRIRIHLIEDMEIYFGLLNSILSSSNILMSISEDDRVHIAIQIFKSFLSSLPDELNPLNLKKPNIKIITSPEITYKESFYLNGILLNIPIPHELQILFPNFEITDASIVLYKLPLQLETIVRNYDHLQQQYPENQKVKMVFEFEEYSSDSLESINIENIAKDMFRELIQKLVSLRVQVVCCQKTIHPFVKFELIRNGILPFERLSIFHIESFREISKATILSEISTVIPQENIGKIQKLSLKKINQTTYFHLEQHPSSDETNYSTIVIGVDSPFISSEIERLTDKCLNILYLMLFHPFVVLGGSNLELRLYSFLKQKIHDEMKIEYSFDKILNEEPSIFGVRFTNDEMNSFSITKMKLENLMEEAISVFKSFSIALLKNESITNQILSDLSLTYDILLGEYCSSVFDFWISKKRSIEEAIQSASLISRIGSVIEVHGLD